MRSRGSKTHTSTSHLPEKDRGAGVDTPSGRLGVAVRTRRKILGLSQAALCDLSGVGLAFLYELEHGKPTVRLDKVLAVLSVLGLELQLREGKLTLSIDSDLASGT